LENPENIQKYYLHKDDFSKLHFEVQDLKSYFDRHKAQASKAHTHGFYQLIWFTASGTHYVDYEINYPKNSLIFIGTNKFILSAHIRTTKESLSISTIFHQSI
jgi:hypothetical protein